MSSSVKLFCAVLMLFSLSYGFDPDLDICYNTSIDSSVYSAERITYIFKDKYYWSTNSLDSLSGIIGFAKLISDKWPEINQRIIASFTLWQQFITVFVGSNNWFAYKNEKKIMEGSTANWPEFRKLSINTMFSIDLLKTEVYVIHDNSYLFNIYDFKDLLNPKLVKKGITSTKANRTHTILWFLDQTEVQSSRTQSLNDTIQIQTSISYKSTLILMSKLYFCRVNLINVDLFDKLCEPREKIYNLLKCPLNLSKRPTLQKPTTIALSISNSGQSSSVSKGSIDRSTTIRPKNESNTLITAGALVQSMEKVTGNSKYIIITIVVVIVISLIVLLISIYFFMRKKSTKKNNLKEIKNKTLPKIGSKISMQTIATINSHTGAPVTDKKSSIETLAFS